MPKFWAKEVWPSSSPDLNPLDYAVWGELERHACATPHPSVEALKASILEPGPTCPPTSWSKAAAYSGVVWRL
ncbi:Uncharacterized protein FKW44_014399 [Caligus rogercresseyi]|uniref:Uncharacterized protein n=1 Tax=Caligus rogercresseyi TaxID=217165 RepID=A0A7T8GZH3_CALRO|nr:Uncharacterized protein FKW44_014399 [Caligus rogercresseyi]